MSIMAVTEVLRHTHDAGIVKRMASNGDLYVSRLDLRSDQDRNHYTNLF